MKILPFPSSLRPKLPSASFALLLTAGLWWGAARSHAQVLLNGSFEGPALPQRSGQNNTGGTDWTNSGFTTLYTNSYGIGSTPFGNQWFALNETGDSDSQTISSGFMLNSTYTLSLAGSDLMGTEGDYLTIAISGGAVASQTFAIPSRPGGMGDSTFPFATYSLLFTATTNAPVTFTLTNTSTGYGTVAIDNVALTLTAAPEPSAWLSMISGFGMLVGFRRFGRQRPA